MDTELRTAALLPQCDYEDEIERVLLRRTSFSSEGSCTTDSSTNCLTDEDCSYCSLPISTHPNQEWNNQTEEFEPLYLLPKTELVSYLYCTTCHFIDRSVGFPLRRVIHFFQNNPERSQRHGKLGLAENHTRIPARASLMGSVYMLSTTKTVSGSSIVHIPAPCRLISHFNGDLKGMSTVQRQLWNDEFISRIKTNFFRLVLETVLSILIIAYCMLESSLFHSKPAPFEGMVRMMEYQEEERVGFTNTHHSTATHNIETHNIINTYGWVGFGICIVGLYLLTRTPLQQVMSLVPISSGMAVVLYSATPPMPPPYLDDCLLCAALMMGIMLLVGSLLFMAPQGVIVVYIYTPYKEVMKLGCNKWWCIGWLGCFLGCFCVLAFDQKGAAVEILALNVEVLILPILYNLRCLHSFGKM